MCRGPIAWCVHSLHQCVLLVCLVLQGRIRRQWKHRTGRKRKVGNSYPYFKRGFDSLVEKGVARIRDMETSRFYKPGSASTQKFHSIIQSKLGSIWNLLEQAENINWFKMDLDVFISQQFIVYEEKRFGEIGVIPDLQSNVMEGSHCLPTGSVS